MSPALRPPEQVMRLARLGAFHQSRLSFMRILTRRMAGQGWRFTRTAFQIDAGGVGHAVYTAHTGQRAYSLVAFAHDLPAEDRSDRVIAEAWDATFCLFDGVPSAQDITRLAANVPKQEAGRISESELSLSRANRSVRLWDHVVARLAAGQQPDPQMLRDVGYLMRTTAVYGSGKFGAADRCVTETRDELHAPFQIEMLSVYLTRWFVRDLVQHMADQAGGAGTARLDPKLAQGLGIGNSTGLGMAPYLLNHPDLLHNWIAARETALARVRGVAQASTAQITLFHDLVARATQRVAEWRSDHPLQQEKLAGLRGDLARLTAHLGQADLHEPAPWDRLFLWAEAHLGLEGQELLAAVLLEPYGDLVDDLAATMASDERFLPLDGSQSVAALRAEIAARYPWALALDWDARQTQARAWYVSAEKLEPRLGQRFDEPIAEYEQPLSPGRDIARLYHGLEGATGDLAQFLSTHPEHRLAARRVQHLRDHPYGEIRDNTIAHDMLPIDMLRCKLSFFGAQQFDPRSDRWVRISMFAGAPYPPDLSPGNCQFWAYPEPQEAGL